MHICVFCRCGKNYGWSRFEGSRCQEAQEDRDGPCLDASRSGFTFPYFEYCHPDYYSDEDEYEFTGDEDICGDRLITGHAVIGKNAMGTGGGRCSIPFVWPSFFCSGGSAPNR